MTKTTERKAPGHATLRQRLTDILLRVSNAASILCVLDCSILPAITLAGLAAGALPASRAHTLHEMGHKLALYFVLPVGSAAALSNYTIGARNLRCLIAAFLGLLCVLAANGHGRAVAWLPRGVHHAGAVHRIVNLAGCGLLLSSNYVSHRALHHGSHKSSNNCCSHSH